MNRFFLFFAGLVISSEVAFAAPCCGGTANIPSVISGDDRTQFTTTLISSQVVADALVGGGIKNRKANDTETAQTLRMDAATLLSDRWQAGLTIPMTRRYRARGENRVSSVGLSDVSFNLAYELVSDWTYTVWRPKVITFVSMIFPTGGSIYDAKELYRIDSRGRGFYALSTGAILIKSWGVWDASLVLEAHRPFSRTISNELGELYLKPGLGASGSVAVGVSPVNTDLRIGLSLNSTYDSPMSTEGVISGSGEKIYLWTPSAQVSYLANEFLSMSLLYSDQTLIRRSENTALNRSVSFLVQKRWER
jgi:hypothetical protein